MVSNESLRELQTRANELAASIPGLEIEIDSEGVPEAAVKGRILIFTYTVTYQEQRHEMQCSDEQLGLQMSSFIYQLKPDMTTEQTDRLHKVQTWEP